MFNLGMGEITVILLLALIFLGPKKLPELASGLGKLIREIRKTTADVKNEIQLDDAIRKPFDELRDAITLHPEELKRRDRLKAELEQLRKQAEAAVAEAEASLANGESEAAASSDGQGTAAIEGTASSSEPGTSDGAPPPVQISETLRPEAPHSDGPANGAAAAGIDPNAGMKTPLPVAAGGVPAMPTAAPVGTVARTPSGPHAAPPAPPLAAVLLKGNGPAATPGTAATPERRAVQPPSGSDFVRSLRAVPDGKRPIPARRSGSTEPAPGGAADRANTTQALTEADLAAITVGGPPPPPATPGKSATRSTQASPTAPPTRLPGATPAKNTLSDKHDKNENTDG